MVAVQVKLSNAHFVSAQLGRISSIVGLNIPQMVHITNACISVRYPTSASTQQGQQGLPLMLPWSWRCSSCACNLQCYQIQAAYSSRKCWLQWCTWSSRAEVCLGLTSLGNLRSGNPGHTLVLGIQIGLYYNQIGVRMHTEMPSTSRTGRLRH